MLDKIISKKIISADKSSSINEVSSLMKKHNIGFIPIKNKNKIIGVITDRDIALSIPYLKSTNDKIEPYISNNIIYINVENNIDDALKLMSTKKVKRLLVKEKDNTVGVLSLSDILNHTDDISISDTYKSIFFINDNNNQLLSEVDDFKI